MQPQPGERMTNMSDGLAYVDEMMLKACQAAAIFTQMDQEQTDRIVAAVYRAGFKHRVDLAKKACEETGLGIWQHKVIKNVLATLLVYRDIRNDKTVGIISDDEVSGIMEIAQPLGPILAVVPMTNPTSTTLFKIMIALKTRNPIIISPHRKALGCCTETAKICYEAALSEGAPDDCIQWITECSREQTKALMTHKEMALILATGGPGLVKAAYSSGTPAIGVGAGNVPVYIEASADVPFAVEQIISSKTFDNGTICASEQAIVVEQSLSDQVKKEFEKQGAYFMSQAEREAVEKIAFDGEQGMMRAEVVGQSVKVITGLAGIDIPDGIKLLMSEPGGVGAEYPMSSEILAPILAYYSVKDFNEAVNLCIDLNYHGGVGHTVSIFSNNEDKIRQFAQVMNAGRIVVNMPSSQGAVGGLFSTLRPSFTLGCGTGGKNITTDNITARHLLNIQRVARRRMNEKWASFNLDSFFDESRDADDIEKEYTRNR